MNWRIWLGAWLISVGLSAYGGARLTGHAATAPAPTITTTQTEAMHADVKCPGPQVIVTHEVETIDAKGHETTTESAATVTQLAPTEVQLDAGAQSTTTVTPSKYDVPKAQWSLGAEYPVGGSGKTWRDSTVSAGARIGGSPLWGTASWSTTGGAALGLRVEF